MTGLFLLAVLAAWAWIAIFVARALTIKVKRAWTRRFGATLLAIILLPVPVYDELITAPQFRTLCEDGTKLKFDPDRIRGRTIFLAHDPQPDISVGFLHGYSIPSRYLDATTNEVLITTNSYHLKGGLLIRMLGISEKTAPLTMRSYCSPQERPWQKTFLYRYELKYIERTDIK